MLVRSKLHPPALPDGAALRPHLLDRLRSGQGQVLTLVCAPAGYGKTTLLAQWMDADADASGFAWVTLDSGDADPMRFWCFLISAVSQVAPCAGRGSLRALRRRPGQLTAGTLPLLMEELDEGGQNLVLGTRRGLATGSIWPRRRSTGSPTPGSWPRWPRRCAGSSKRRLAGRPFSGRNYPGGKWAC